jgi:hypothetical protein
MQHSIHKHDPHHIESAVAVVKPCLTRFFGVPEPAGITEPRRKTYVALARAQEFAATQVLHHVDHGPVHD